MSPFRMQTSHLILWLFTLLLTCSPVAAETAIVTPIQGVPPGAEPITLEVSPPPDALLRDPRPVVKVTVGPFRAGSPWLAVNGEDVTEQASNDGVWITWRPARPLAPGTYTVEFAAADSYGGGISYEWLFHVEVKNSPEAGWCWRKRFPERSPELPAP